ncbi:MAG TPA: hypothetical protein V6D06_12605, partial [Trichocoleus sp.]
ALGLTEAERLNASQSEQINAELPELSQPSSTAFESANSEPFEAASSNFEQVELEPVDSSAGFGEASSQSDAAPVEPIDAARRPSKRQTEPPPSARGRGSARRLKRTAETSLNRRRRSDDAAAAKVPYRRRELSLADQVLLFIANVGGVWKQLLRGVRSRLPADWQAQLPDEILSAVLLGVLFLLLVLWNPLGGDKAPDVAPAPSPALSAEAPAAGSEIASEAPESEFEAVESRALEVSPEQTLIADIQEQVASITQTYAAGLIQSVRVNFQQSTLKVNLGPQWYDLTKPQQEQLAQDVLLRSQELNFGKLYLFDEAGALVARNPVVGSRMIILQRLSATEDPLRIANRQ